MSKHKNIYETPGEPPPGEEEKYMVDLTLAEARRRTIRSLILFAGVVVTLMGLVIWIILGEQDKQKPPPPEEEMVQDLLGSSRKSRETAPAFPVPEMPFQDPGPAEDAGLLSGEQMAEAMGYMRLAKTAFQAQNWDLAEEHVRKALAIHSTMNAAMRMLGIIFIHRGQFDQAIAVLDEVLKQNPYNPEVLNNLASAYIQRRQADKAEELLQTAIRMDPNYATSYLNLGLLYLLRGEYQLTIDYLERGLPRAPRDTGVRNNLGVAFMRLGRYDEARQQFSTILDLDRSVVPAYFNMAITYALEGDPDKAMEWIEDGAELCSPVMLKRVLDDADFESLRTHPDFQRIQQRLVPRLPPGPGSNR